MSARRALQLALTAIACVALLCAGLSSCSSGGDPTAAHPTPTSSPSASPSASPTASPTATASAPAPITPPVAPQLAVVPPAGAGPKVRFPVAPPAIGKGAAAVISAIPNAVWNRMVGYSWTSGCPVGRSGLRLVGVNYWGFDGLRHRGSLVVASAISSRTAAAFTTLYDLRFRIRQMRPMDSTWGQDPKGPGADDYAAMDADNTSAFNCRYVGGEESRKVWSNHAYGRAIDINDFENPYVDASGRVYPSSYFLHRRTGAGVLASSHSSAVRAFTSRGFSWGGLWSDPDLQHLEIA